VWDGGASFGSVNANEITASGAPAPLFATSSRLTGSAGIGVKVALRVAQLFEVEASGSYLRPSIETTVGSDVEGAAGSVLPDRLRQITIEGDVLYTVGRWRGRRIRPFFAAGAGYLRQLHAGDTLAANGRVFDAGGGVRIPLGIRSGRRLSAYGVRGDARLLVRMKGVAIDASTHVSPSIAASLYAVF
jgi:hypothetical protein